ncbi:uncharacterized protein DUF998 [Breznakia blatticola]|uniref:Uncharacterized protein DUF998 n=1 Tax=Breznakia blatticola TaxID=1754012 RepID=A0A4R7Z8X1_9FIRM|nr:DUF998 domain-containing protein [Breznakia blatticola]TDW13176.1 uncharacterized protein DUF998 [Breznakia blatticola]
MGFLRKKKKQEPIITEEVTLPSHVLESLEVEEGEHAFVLVEGNKLRIAPINKQKSAPIKQMIWVLLICVLVTVGFYYMFKDTNQVSFVGEQSIASATLLVGSLCGIISFSFFFILAKQQKIETSSKYIYWRNFPAVLISFGLILILFLMGFFKVMELTFSGASFDVYTASFMFFVFNIIITYAMSYLAIIMTPSLLTRVLSFVIVGGVVMSMVNNNDQDWWKENFSYLGTPEAINSWRFNVTLVFSAMLLVALIDYIFVILQQAIPESKRLSVLRVLLTLTALCLGGVGMFPYNEIQLFRDIHDIVARLLVVFIVLLICLLRWLLPKVSKEFLWVSYGIGGILILATILFLQVDYLSLMAYELIAFIFAFVWIIMLLQQLQNLVNQVNSFTVILKGQAPVKVQEIENIDEQVS